MATTDRGSRPTSVGDLVEGSTDVTTKNAAAKHAPGAWGARPRLAWALLALAPTVALAFKVISPANHENITMNAIRSVMPGADPMMINNIQQGVINTDLTHFSETEFHFDNSTANNGGFDNGFAAISDMALQAHAEAMMCDGSTPCDSVNPLFVNPQHPSYRELLESIAETYMDLSLTDGCLGEPACWSADLAGRATFIYTALLPMLVVDQDPDPDTVTVLPNGLTTNGLPNLAPLVLAARQQLDAALGGTFCRPWPYQQLCFVGIGSMAPGHADFHLDVGRLEVLQFEYQAYFAWQHLGHAMHTTEDFFAHSNYVELVSCRKGPPCDATRIPGAAAICDTPLDGAPASWTSLPLPTDGRSAQDLVQFFLPSFSQAAVNGVLNAQPRVFADDNSAHLQTGNFPCLLQSPDSSFQYCHTGGGDTGVTTAAGLNKDKAYGAGEEPNHQNFDWANLTATREAAALFTSFMYSFVDGPPRLATNPLAGTAPVGPRPSCGISVAASASPRVTVQVAPVGQPPALTPTRATLRPRILPGAPLAASVKPAFAQRVLSHPELLTRDPRPRIFVKIAPNRAFRPGERVSIRVDAFDARTGEPVAGMPVSVGTQRGVTGAPFALTVPAAASSRCTIHGGERVCIATPAALAGTVDDPAGRYPGGGGRFSLSIIAPRLQATILGGPAVTPDAPGFTVSAVDSASGKPVVGAEVLVAGRLVGPANKPLALRLPSPPPAPSAVGPVALGPSIVVRAPGYGEQLVNYFVVPRGTPMPPH